MNLNYDRLAAIKTALDNMQPGSATRYSCHVQQRLRIADSPD